MNINQDNKYMRLNENIPEIDKKTKKKGGKINGPALLFGFCALLSLTGFLYMLFTHLSFKQQLKKEQEAKPITYTVEETEELKLQAVNENTANIKATMKEMLMSGDGALSMVRYFFPEELVAVYGNEYSFFPISETLKKNDYLQENFQVKADGEMEYHLNGNKVSKKGIDVSKYQGEIDWNLVRGSNVEYAFLRLGIRGYESGAIVLDETFETNIQGATSAGVGVGVYFFTQAITVEEAIEEADFVLEQIAPYQVTYPVVLDVEDITDELARTKNLTKEERTEIAIAFLERIKEAGYTPMIYGNLKTFLVMLDMEKLEEYSKWFAYYTYPIYFPYAYDYLQYTEKGTVLGIEGEVDLNLSFQ